MTNYETTNFYEHGEPLVAEHPFVKTFESVTNNDREAVGGKALHLAAMSNHGIPVPQGVCVTAEAHNLYLISGALEPELVNELESLRVQLGGQIAVRSSATCEDGAEVSMAGVFDTHYLFDDTQDISSAMTAIYEQCRSQEVADSLALHGFKPEQVKMGIVVQRLVAADQSGVLYTDVNGDNLLAQYIDGLGEDLVDGRKEGSSILMNQAGVITQSKGFTGNPLTVENLAQLTSNARSIRELFKGVPQDIEFAIEDGKLQILQARTLTAEINNVELAETPAETLQAVKQQLEDLVQSEKTQLGSERVAFSDSNFSEIMPQPKEMDIGVFAYIFTGRDGVPGAIQLGRKEMGYPLGDESVGFMHLIGGKPYFSLARDAHTFYAGFPATSQEYSDTLVNEYLVDVENDPAKGEYPEMGLYLQDPTLEQLRLKFGDKAEAYFDTYLQFRDKLAGEADTFLTDYEQHQLPAEVAYIKDMTAIPLAELSSGELLDFTFDVLEHLRNESCVNFVKAARLGFYYSQRLQTFLQQELGVTPEGAEDLFSKLTQGLDGSAITEANLAIANTHSPEDALSVGRVQVGHYSSGEMLEIRHPRLSEDEESLKDYVDSIYQNRHLYSSEFAKQQEQRLAIEQEVSERLGEDKVAEFRHTMAATQTYMALRETVKYHFVAEYALIRNALLELSATLEMEPEAIFSVYPRELPHLVTNSDSFRTTIRERRQAFANYPELEMPPVIREADIIELALVSDSDELVKEMSGKLLAQGNAIENGFIVNVDEYDDPKIAMQAIEAAKQEGLQVILVASQMNLSHDPLIVVADGIVIENAGLVSHGAQRARELGRGAIGGVKSKHLKTGERVSFDPHNRKITRILED